MKNNNAHGTKLISIDPVIQTSSHEYFLGHVYHECIKFPYSLPVQLRELTKTLKTLIKAKTSSTSEEALDISGTVRFRVKV